MLLARPLNKGLCDISLLESCWADEGGQITATVFNSREGIGNKERRFEESQF